MLHKQCHSLLHLPYDRRVPQYTCFWSTEFDSLSPRSSDESRARAELPVISVIASQTNVSSHPYEILQLPAMKLFMRKSNNGKEFNPFINY